MYLGQVIQRSSGGHKRNSFDGCPKSSDFESELMYLEVYKFGFKALLRYPHDFDYDK